MKTMISLSLIDSFNFFFYSLQLISNLFMLILINYCDIYIYIFVINNVKIKTKVFQKNNIVIINFQNKILIIFQFFL